MILLSSATTPTCKVCTVITVEVLESKTPVFIGSESIQPNLDLIATGPPSHRITSPVLSCLTQLTYLSLWEHYCEECLLGANRVKCIYILKQRQYADNG